jgi:hypothetical protein
MSGNVRSAMASENVRFVIAVVIALVLVGTYYMTSEDTTTESYSELSNGAPAADAQSVPAR